MWKLCNNVVFLKCVFWLRVMIWELLCSWVKCLELVIIIEGCVLFFGWICVRNIFLKLLLLMFLMNSIELLLVVCWNCFCVSVVMSGFVFVFVNILFWWCDDYGFVYIMLIVVMIVVNIVRIIVVFIRIVLFRL